MDGGGERSILLLLFSPQEFYTEVENLRKESEQVVWCASKW